MVLWVLLPVTRSYADFRFNPYWQDLSGSDAQHWKQIHGLMETMTPEEKIGQLLMVGINGRALTAQTRRLIQDLKVGGVILYSHNVSHPEQLLKFTRELQEISKFPLFISADQEGGSVTRINKRIQVLPSAMAIGATHSAQFSFLAGKMTARALSAMGINMNLAPVLDINTEEENHTIGVRSYGDDPELVAQLGMWYIEGLQSQDVAATAKHFPGHGNTVRDSHYLIPVLNESLSGLEKFQLIPFQKAIDSGLDAIMTAHISVPELDPSQLPATLSYNLLTTLIRKKMNFKGIVITDDLEMGAITKHYKVREAALKALLAGADIVMIGWTDTQKQSTYRALIKAYQEGALSMDRINESLARILTLKLKRGLFNSARTPASLAALQHPQHVQLANQIAAKAITLVKDEQRILPLKQDDPRRVLLVTPFKSFYREVAFFHNRVSPYFISRRPTVGQIQQALAEISQKAASADFIVFGLTHYSQLALINRIADKINKPIVVVSFQSPYFGEQLSPRVSTYVCSYGTQKELVYATAKVLAGLVRPSGKLPVTLTSRSLAKKHRPTKVSAN